MADQTPKGSKTRDWILRIVIFGTLAVVLALAIMDFQVKKQAEQTGIAWREQLKQANASEFARLPLEKLAESIQGTPELTENEKQNIYTWNGTFRKYVITVSYFDYSGKPVDEISGPGENDAE